MEERRQRLQEYLRRVVSLCTSDDQCPGEEPEEEANCYRAVHPTRSDQGEAGGDAALFKVRREGGRGGEGRGGEGREGRGGEGRGGEGRGGRKEGRKEGRKIWGRGRGRERVISLGM